jgi:hypothetical protein
MVFGGVLKIESTKDLAIYRGCLWLKFICYFGFGSRIRQSLSLKSFLENQAFCGKPAKVLDF